MFRQKARMTMLASLVALMLLATLAGFARAQDDNRSVAAVPEGFEQYLVYMSNPSTEAASRPVSYEEFLAFQQAVWGRDADDVAAFREEAITFFAEQFGIDFSGVEIDENGVQTMGDLRLTPSFLRPERGYRAYTVGGERVPAEGWEVRDATFGIRFSEDTVLHGAYGGEEGKTAPAGSSVVFGDYNIKVERPGQGDAAAGRGGDEIRIRVMSSGPIARNADGVTTFVCFLEHEEWGSGLARGLVTPDGSIRNVLTFPSAQTNAG